jgi:hypothetical protein
VMQGSALTRLSTHGAAKGFSLGAPQQSVLRPVPVQRFFPMRSRARRSRRCGSSQSAMANMPLRRCKLYRPTVHNRGR